MKLSSQNVLKIGKEEWLVEWECANILPSSFVKIVNDLVVQTAEKNPISNHAIAGFYYFKNGIDFINGAFNVIRYDDNYNGNYFTSAVYNQLILAGKKIKTYQIQNDEYHSFYSIQKLKEFEEHLNFK